VPERNPNKLEKSPRIALIDVRSTRVEQVAAVLASAGFSDVTRCAVNTSLMRAASTVNAELVVLVVDEVDAEFLREFDIFNCDHARPLVLITTDEDPVSIRAAVKIGAHAYVVGEIDARRVHAAILLAIARFDHEQGLLQELDDLHAALNDRKVIERAKGLLMKQRGMDEETAYVTLRSEAMSRNLKLADLARNVLSVAELLV
jgi:two-component system, response regulator / RNA-binding antiterminator